MFCLLITIALTYFQEVIHVQWPIPQDVALPENAIHIGTYTTYSFFFKEPLLCFWNKFHTIIVLNYNDFIYHVTL